MPYPYPRIRESADACAALMAKLHSQFPLDSDNMAHSIRTRYLQAERHKPYRLPVSSKRNATGKCRKTRPVSSLGWGAFLKDETLRTPEGKVVRVAQEPCPTRTSISLPCVRTRLSGQSILPREHCLAREAPQDCAMSLATPLDERRCGNGDDDDEMLSCGAFDSNQSPLDLEMDPVVPCWERSSLHHSGEVEDSERLCIQAADDMFVMFIDETCMEV
ncbi:hypothetical protein B0H12DRAFT_1099098, partial [Mycena haematopus]